MGGLGWVLLLASWVGLGWVCKLVGWVGLGEEKWTHVHLWIGLLTGKPVGQFNQHAYNLSLFKGIKHTDGHVIACLGFITRSFITFIN
jgi:hypothetical protein